LIVATVKMQMFLLGNTISVGLASSSSKTNIFFEQRSRAEATKQRSRTYQSLRSRGSKQSKACGAEDQRRSCKATGGCHLRMIKIDFFFPERMEKLL
jgi:hypothetical protein